MAETPENVTAFLEDLLKKAKPAAEKEFGLLSKLAKKDAIDSMEKWDGAYYAEKLKAVMFDFDQ